MDESQKFDLTINAIIEARKASKSDAFVAIELTPDHRLHDLPRPEVLEILERFQLQDKVIKLSDMNYPANRPDRRIISIREINAHPSSSTSTATELTDEQMEERAKTAEALLAQLRRSIALSILPGFDNWHAGYLLRKKDDLDSLSPVNLAKIYCTVLDMDEKLQMKASPAISVNLLFHHVTPLLGTNFPYSTYRTDALDYLKNKGVVSGYKIQFAYSDFKITGGYVDITVNIPQFQKFKPRILQVYRAKEKELLPPEISPHPASEGKNPAPQDSDIVYEVKRLSSREILINGLQIARPLPPTGHEALPPAWSRLLRLPPLLRAYLPILPGT